MNLSQISGFGSRSSPVSLTRLLRKSLPLMFLVLMIGCKVKPSGETNHQPQIAAPALNNAGTSESKEVTEGKEGNTRDAFPFTVLESFSQKRISGIAGGSNTMEYGIIVSIQTSEKIEFDTLWIDGSAYRVFVTHKTRLISGEPVSFSQNDTVNVRVSVSSSKEKVNVTPPFQYKGAALLSYKMNGSKSYFEIASISKKPDVFGQ